ncbi:signal peptidase I [Intrasporangium flavum]|uniref:signal peptidase I n=1 Tax=Intrasporangium flavum TaxID=1428657 RepID=UPI00096E47C7|nr:signal peptidase I [Intrasporangium flavum]
MTADTPHDEGSAAPSASQSHQGVSRSRTALRRHRWMIGPAVLLLAVVVVRAFLVTPFGIPSESMEDTLLVGDRILVSRTTAPEQVQRGDIIVFDASQAFGLRVPERGFLQTLVEAAESIIGKGQPTDYVKRVIGLPGDHVRCCAADGRLEVNGVAIDEPYLAPGQKPSLVPFDVRVPADRFWVMGDNRGSSSDSRAHLGDPGGGMVPGEDVIGKVWVRYWPLGRLGPVDQGQISSVPRNGE